MLVNTMLSRALTARELADKKRQEALGELEAVNRELGEQASEMEAQTVELEQANEELRTVSDDLARQTSAAERASERVVNVLDTMSDAFISFDRDWTIRQFNREGVRLTTGNGPTDRGQSALGSVGAVDRAGAGRQSCARQCAARSWTRSSSRSRPTTGSTFG